MEVTYDSSFSLINLISLFLLFLVKLLKFSKFFLMISNIFFLGINDLQNLLFTKSLNFTVSLLFFFFFPVDF